MRIYLASRFSRKPELVLYRDALRELGQSVECRWLEATHDLPVGSADQRLGAGYANDDVEDLAASDALIAFTGHVDGSRGRGGYHVEFGLALAWAKRLAIVGPRENVFHYLVDDVFESFGQLLQSDWLRG